MNLDLVLNTINQCVFCKNTEGVYVYVNEPFARIAGETSAEAVIGKTDYDLIWHEDADAYRQEDERVLAGEVIVNAEVQQIRKDHIARILLSKTILRSALGEVLGITGNFMDLSDELILRQKGSYDQKKGRLHLEFVSESLTASEVSVCFYLLHGFPANKIAEKTGTSVSGIRYHIENIKNKMQCDNKHEITEVAMKTGIAWKIFSLFSQHHMESV